MMRSVQSFEREETFMRVDGIPHSSYRAFRAALLARLQDLSRSGVDQGFRYTPRRSLREAKQHIDVFRAYVRLHAMTFVQVHPAYRALVLRALGIPDDLPVLRPRAVRTLHWLAWQLRGEAVRLVQGRRLLSRVRTFAGRQLVYDQLIRTYTLPGYLSAGDDLILRKVRAIADFAQLNALCRLPDDLVMVGLQLGVDDASALLAAVQPLAHRINAQAIRILVEEGILTEVSQFAWLAPYLTDPRDRYLGAEHIDARELRSTVRLLREAGVSSPVLVGVLKRWAWPKANALARVLHRLHRAGVIDIDTLFHQLGPLLWTVETAVLSFVLEVIGARDATSLAQFREVLARDRVPARVLVEALVARGATARDLAQCQQLLVETARWEEEVCVGRLHRLMSPPYALTFVQLDGCASYLRPQREDTFDAFLDVLIQFGLVGVGALNAFRPVWDAHVSPTTLSRLLDLAATVAEKLSVEELATWVLRSRNKRLDTMAYIQARLGVPSISALFNLAKLGELTLPLVYYLIEICGIRSFGQLKRWYFDEGKNADAHRSDSAMKPSELELILFKFATRQADFSHVGDNYACLVDALYHHAREVAGEWSPDWNDAEREAYVGRKQQAYAEAAARLCPQLLHLLERTDGTLLRGVIDYAIAGRIDLEALLDSLDPLIDGLLHGRDEHGEAPLPLVLDAISLVYGVPQAVVAKHWRQVSGKSHHLDGLTLRAGYAMRWDQLARVAQPLSPAEMDARQMQLDSFVVALDVLHAWRLAPSNDPSSILGQLDLRVIDDAAAQPAKLAPYLGLLLCIADQDPLTRPLLDTLGADIVDAAYDGLVRLDNFVGAVLPEGIAVGRDAFLSALSEEARERLARVVARLGVGNDLSQGVVALQRRVLRPFEKWLASDRERFPAQRGEPKTVMAHVSKSPAAFFARHSVMLCSRDNVALWDEARHCHLVVFDQATKRFVGMAMLYFQALPGYFRGQRCLIVRAINLSNAALAAFDPLSVVAEFARVAEMIGRENRVAAVLFPNESTFLTNQREVEKAVADFPPMARAREIGRAEGTAGPGPALFEAFEQGSRQGAVQCLEVLWERDRGAVSA